MSEWQPIETAPRNATEILVILANHDVHVVYGHYYDLRQKFEWAQFDGVNDYNPTHWMPLPKPPESKHE